MQTDIYDWSVLNAALMQDGTVAGPDMQYEAKFLSLESSSKYQEERQVGGSVLPGRDPDWPSIFIAGSELLTKTRDLRVVAIAAEAAVHRYGLQGLQQSLQLVRTWLLQFWDDVHPQLWIDGELDPLLRSNAIATLADTSGMVKSIRLADFVSTPIGLIAVADAEKLLKGMDADAAVVRSKSELLQVIEGHQNKEGLRDLLLDCQQYCKDIVGICEEKIDAEYWPNLSVLNELLEILLSAFEIKKIPPSAVAAEHVLDTDSAVSAGFKNAAEDVQSVHSLPRAIANSSDAFLALGLVRDYFEKHEPSHPAPLLIRRIERLQGKDFLAMVQDLTPEGLRQLAVVSGVDGEISP